MSRNNSDHKPSNVHQTSENILIFYPVFSLIRHCYLSAHRCWCLMQDRSSIRLRHKVSLLTPRHGFSEKMITIESLFQTTLSVGTKYKIMSAYRYFFLCTVSLKPAITAALVLFLLIFQSKMPPPLWGSTLYENMFSYNHLSQLAWEPDLTYRVHYSSPEPPLWISWSRVLQLAIWEGGTCPLLSSITAKHGLPFSDTVLLGQNTDVCVGSLLLTSGVKRPHVLSQMWMSTNIASISLLITC